jgi:hypothetical protein
LFEAAEAEREKYQADHQQQYAEQMFTNISQTIEKLEKNSRRSINKSK